MKTRWLLLFDPGCFISGLYLEGADWDMENGCLVKSKPKVLVVPLPILKVIPTESRHLSLQVRASSMQGNIGYNERKRLAGQGIVGQGL